MNLQSEVISDPRTIARNVSGIFDAVFPQLAPSMVAHFNRTFRYDIDRFDPVPSDILNHSNLERAMLFELALAISEQLLVAPDEKIDWEAGLSIAGKRQKKYFDAKVPDELESADREISLMVAENVISALKVISMKDNSGIVTQPLIPGFRWIATGLGDFATNSYIIEVKCSSRRFSSSDYRQIIMYWLLRHIKSLESSNGQWTKGALLNPRLGSLTVFSFHELIPLIAFNRSLNTVVQKFRAIVDQGPMR